MTPVPTIITNVFLFFALYMQVLLLFTFIERRGSLKPQKERTKLGAYRPSVAILIPCYNEEHSLKGTVESLLSLRYPKDRLQVVIINDGSTDNTLAVANQFAKNPRVKIISKENGGKHTALNAGLAVTESELVGCLDADSFVEPGALIEIVRVFENEGIMAVTPAMRVHNPGNILQKMQRMEYNVGIFLRKMFGEMNGLHVTPGPFSIFRRRVFDTIGIYRKAHNTEDLEIALRMHKHHLPIANAHRAYVYTITPRTVRALYKQRLRWVYGFLKNAIDYREMILNRKYGNIGMVTLPAAVASIITALFFAGLALWNFGEQVSERLLQWFTVGVRFSWDMFAFDWFFMNTTLTGIMVYILFATTATMIILGKRMAENNSRFSIDMVYFVVIYGLLAPLWLSKAVFNVLFARTSSWR